MFDIKKKIGMALLGVSGIATAVMALPQMAFADVGWKPNDMLNNAVTGANISTVDVTQKAISDVVISIATWVLGIAIILFVAKVICTAIDRMLFQNPDTSDNSGTRKANNGGGGSILQSLPVVGAYPNSFGWKEIWIHFAKNVAITVGAWLVVQILVGIISFAFTSLS